MKKVCTLLCTSVALLASCNQSNNFKTTNKLNEVTFDVEFHRGGRNSRPENTLYSYVYSIEKGATTIECDMQLLDNGEIIMSHEPLLDPNTFRDEKGVYVESVEAQYRKDIREMSIEEIKKYDVAKVKPGTDYYKEHGVTQKTPEHAKIPTIDELFSLVKNCERKVQINIETKIFHDLSVEPRARKEADPKLFAQKFMDKVNQYGLIDQIIVQSFDWQSLIEVKKINKNIRTSALSSSQPPYWGIDDYLRPMQPGASPYLAGYDIDDFLFCDPVRCLIKLNQDYKSKLGFNVVDIFSPYCKELTIDQVNLAHENNMKVLPWNANSKEEIEAMIDIGVDGIISDNGELLRDIVLKKGYTLFSEYDMKNSIYHIN